MLKFLSLLLSLAFCLVPHIASAQCGEGDGSFLCYDESGTEYHVVRSGNTTHMTATSTSGETWSQESYRTGNVVQHYGNAANGKSWFVTQTINSDGSQTYDGIDAAGNPVFYTCDRSKNCY